MTPQPAEKILITGAASGIGRAAAQHFAQLGAALVLIDRDAAGLDMVLSGNDAVTRLVGDVADVALWEKAAPSLTGLTGALVNAGISSAATIEQMDFAAWRRVLAVNLDGAFLTLQAAMRAIAARHATDSAGGAIVLTASATALKAEIGIAAYAASKAAVIQMAKVAAKEGANRNIRVNAIAPGGVDTAIWDSMPAFADTVKSLGSREAAVAAMAKAGTPLGRFASADDIAAQVAFLMSSAASSVTGAVLVGDGGYSL
ncbi:MAG: SDR family oxidoreductase [Sphingopyxis sp.]|nr:SDR family oxidoreductase [Sphingopyxis sp.]